jgi:hypothetical protein
VVVDINRSTMTSGSTVPTEADKYCASTPTAAASATYALCEDGVPPFAVRYHRACQFLSDFNTTAASSTSSVTSE